MLSQGHVQQGATLEERLIREAQTLREEAKLEICGCREWVLLDGWAWSRLRPRLPLTADVQAAGGIGRQGP